MISGAGHVMLGAICRSLRRDHPLNQLQGRAPGHWTLTGGLAEDPGENGRDLGGLDQRSALRVRAADPSAFQARRHDSSPAQGSRHAQFPGERYLSSTGGCDHVSLLPTAFAPVVLLAHLTDSLRLARFFFFFSVPLSSSLN